MNRGRSVSVDAALTCIPSVAAFRGDLRFSGSLRVDGQIIGDVLAEPVAGSMVHVGSEGRIEGRVEVATLVVEGQVSGPVRALERLELRAGGRLTGEVCYRDLQIQHGALLEGGLTALDAHGQPMAATLRLDARRRDG